MIPLCYTALCEQAYSKFGLELAGGWGGGLKPHCRLWCSSSFPMIYTQEGRFTVIIDKKWQDQYYERGL